MLGDRLKELREDKGLNQDQLADMLGITRSAVSSYETNVNLPSLEIAVKIANIFNISLDYLTCRTKEMHNINLFDKKSKTLILDIIKSIEKYERKEKTSD